MGERQKRPAKAGNGQRRNERAGEILDVALRLFAEQGYTNVTLKDIARAGRINAALVYYYYQNKEYLFVAALKHAVNQALAGGQSCADSTVDGDPIAQIQMWFDANERLAKPLGQMLRLMLEYRASRRRSASLQRLIARFYEAEMLILSDAIKRGIAMEVFRPVDVAKTALFISTHLDGLMVAATVRSKLDLKRALRQLQDILFDYLGVERPVPSAARPGGAAIRRAS